MNNQAKIKLEKIKKLKLPEKVRATADKIEKGLSSADAATQKKAEDALNKLYDQIKAVAAKQREEKTEKQVNENTIVPQNADIAAPEAKKQLAKKTTVADDVIDKALKEDPELAGFGKSDKRRDAGRKAQPAGRRVARKGWKNQYGKSDGGRVYFENRENRTDRKSPSFKSGYPYLAKGGKIHPMDEEDGTFYVNLYKTKGDQMMSVDEREYKSKASAMTYAMMKRDFMKEGESIFVMNDDGDVLYTSIGTKKMAMGGKFPYQNAQVGDSARVILENKMGTIMVAYGRRFHLKFPDGTEKTYSAEELEFYPEDEMMAKGGDIQNTTFVVKNLDGKIVLKTKSLNKASDYQGLVGRDTHTVETLDGRILSASGGYMAEGGEVGNWRGNVLGDGSIELINSDVYIRDNTGNYGRGRYDVYKRGNYDRRTNSIGVTLLASFDDLNEAKQYGYDNNYAKGGYMKHRGTITDDSLESILKSDFPKSNYQLDYNEINGHSIYGQKEVIQTIQKHLLNEYGITSEYVKEGFGLPFLRVNSQFVDKYAQGGYMAEGENYEYVNTFKRFDSNVPVPQEDFEKLVDAYHKQLSGDKLAVSKYKVLKLQMGNYLGHKTVEEMEEYIEKTHNAHKMADGGVVSNLELLKTKIRDKSKKLQVDGEDGYGGYVIYMSGDKISLSDYTDLKPYSAQASDDEIKMSFFDTNGQMVIFSTYVEERFEDDESFKKYGGIKYIYEPLTNEISGEILRKVYLDKMADGGVIGSGKNGYVAFFKGKRIEVYADSMYGAQKTAAQYFKAKRESDVNVVLAEVDGKPYIQSTAFATGGYVSKRDIEAITIVNPNKSNPKNPYLTFRSGEFLNGLNQFAKGGKLTDNYTYIKRSDVFAVYYKDKSKKYFSVMENKPKNGFWVSKKALIREGGKTPSAANAPFDAYELYNELSEMNSKVWDKLKIQSGSEIYASDSLQKKLAVEYPNSGIDAKFKSLKAIQRKKVAEIMTDENEHSLRNYLTLRGYLGQKEYDRKVSIFDPKRPYNLNPANFKNTLKKMAEGGKIGFEALSKKVASRYAGKNVKPKYQGEYGKTYDKAEAKEVGDKVAAKVYRMQQGKMAMGGELEKGIRTEMKEHGMSREEATKTANDHLKEDAKYYTKMAKIGLKDGGKIELPHELDRYFTKPAGTIEVEMNKLIPIRARKSGIENAEVYMKKAYDGKMSKRKPIEIYKTRNKKYRVNDGNSTYAVAKKNGWETIYATVVSNPNIKNRVEKSTFAIAKEIRKEGEKWSDAVKRVKENRK